MIKFILILVVVVVLVFNLGCGWRATTIMCDLNESGESVFKYGDFGKYTVTIVGSAKKEEN